MLGYSSQVLVHSKTLVTLWENCTQIVACDNIRKFIGKKEKDNLSSLPDRLSLASCNIRHKLRKTIGELKPLGWVKFVFHLNLDYGFATHPLGLGMFMEIFPL